MGNLFILRCKTCASIDKKEDDICLFHGNLCLLAHGCEHVIALVKFNAARIDHGELMVQPVCIHVDTVTRDARHIIDNRQSLPADLVKKRRLADIRPSHNRNDWFHLYSS